LNRAAIAELFKNLVVIASNFASFVTIDREGHTV
jgi:hypothetical protein